MTNGDLPSLAATRRLLADINAGGVMPRVGTAWTGKLFEWLHIMRNHDPDGPNPERVQTWSFPTDELLQEYVRIIGTRDQAEVMQILRCFMFDMTTFERDADHLQRIVARIGAGGPGVRNEFERRLFRPGPAHPGARWIIDLLPFSPRLAIDAIDAYMLAHAQELPDGRFEGLSDAKTLIRAYFIGRDLTSAQAALASVSSREFEVLTAQLYLKLGYEVELTPSVADGGRDILARRLDSGRQHVTLVECKHHGSPVGVRHVRALLGAVAHERANTGVLIASGSFTRGARNMADREPRIELVDGATLCRLMDEHFSPDWLSRESLLSERDLALGRSRTE